MKRTARPSPVKVALYEPSGEARTALCDLLRELGCVVAGFGDAHIAFLYLLGHREVDGVIVNVGTLGRGRWLIDRLELSRLPLALVTYADPERPSGGHVPRWLGDRPQGDAPLAR